MSTNKQWRRAKKFADSSKRLYWGFLVSPYALTGDKKKTAINLNSKHFHKGEGEKKEARMITVLAFVLYVYSW